MRAPARREPIELAVRAAMRALPTRSATRAGPWLLAGIAVALALTAPAFADDDPVFRIEFKDGTMTPLRLEVPAHRRFSLELHNLGETPAEFESRELRKEKVLAPGTTSVLVIRTLEPGEYDFFDDFHPDAPPAVLVAN